MWALHKLKATRKARNEQCEDDPPSPPVLLGLSEERQDPPCEQVPIYTSPWDFSQEDLEQFPALRGRNFWCIQRHQARALHYDLRMQLDGTTMSWAIPRGLLGISKQGERNRLAVETTLHPISYTTYEGGDGRILPSGERCGTLLWDVGTYTIDYPWNNDDSDSEDEKRRRKRQRDGNYEESDDPLGKHQEDKFRMAMTRPIRAGKSRSIHFTLKGGRKMENNSYVLIQSPQNAFANTYSSTGRRKTCWFISLPKGIEGYSWGPGGEEGEQYGRSVKTRRTLREVCAARERIKTFDNEREMFRDWVGDITEIDAGEAVKMPKAKRKKVK